jgi:acetyltransferase-like isoleucine patch superfamily enzyme
MVGTGFYALSEAGRSRFDEFPDIIADDQFVLSRFDEAERCSVGSAEFVVAAPCDWRSLIYKKTRAYTGNRQLEERFGTQGARQPGGRSAWMDLVRRHPSLLPSLPAYVLVCAVAETRSRRQVRRRDFGTWERDDSTRVAMDYEHVSGPRHRHGAAAFARNVSDPRSWLHVLRIIHYYGYAHVRERPKIQFGPGAKIAPNVSLRNGERVSIGARSNVGERCSLWAGDHSGRITIGSDVLLAPQVFITASNYQFAPDSPIMAQPRQEADVVIGNDVWLGAGVVVVPGVTIGNGCVVGAGSVVTRSLPAGSIAAGCPARVHGARISNTV